MDIQALKFTISILETIAMAFVSFSFIGMIFKYRKNEQPKAGFYRSFFMAMLIVEIIGIVCIWW